MQMKHFTRIGRAQWGAVGAANMGLGLVEANAAMLRIRQFNLATVQAEIADR